MQQCLLLLLANSHFLRRFCSSAAQFAVSQEVLEFSQASKRTSQPCDTALKAARCIQQPPCCIVAARPLQQLPGWISGVAGAQEQAAGRVAAADYGG